MTTWKFRVPLEGETQTTTAREYATRLWPEATAEQIEGLFQKGQAQAGGILITRPDRSLDPDSLVEITADEAGEEVFGLPDVEALLWGDDWVIVDKPVGIPGRLSGDDPMDPIRFMADMLGVDRDGFMPAWEMPAAAGGPWVMGRTEETARRVARQMVDGEIKTTFVALILRPDRSQGRFTTKRGTLDFAVSRTEGMVAEVQLTPMFTSSSDDAGQLYFELLAMMAEAGYPVLGDGLHGAYLVAGGVRLRLGAVYGTEEFSHSWPSPRGWWPDEEVVAPLEEEDEEVEEDSGDQDAGRRASPASGVKKIGTLAVSKQTLDVLRKKGHPWVLHDRDTGSIEGVEPGTPLQLVGPSGPAEIYAVADGTGPIVARVWSEDKEQATHFLDELEIRLDEAIAARASYFRDLGETDVFRIVHGQADGIPGLWVDRVGPLMRVTTLGRCALGYREAIYEMLRLRDPSGMILEVEHLRDLRRREKLPQAQIVYEGANFLRPGDDLVVHEAGLRFRVEPWEGVDVGFFADQRDNRQEAVKRAQKGERWLNLFCHTGAFSVALARAGVHTTNVDLSRRYLRWLDDNFELNNLGVNLRENIDDDARVFLSKTEEKFDGIIVDPPTAASGDAGFWSVQRDYEELLMRAFEVLKEGGSMLACRNEKRPRTTLKKLVERAAKKANRTVTSIEKAGPADDYPRLKGFEEGDKFEGVWVN